MGTLSVPETGTKKSVPLTSARVLYLDTSQVTHKNKIKTS